MDSRNSGREARQGTISGSNKFCTANKMKQILITIALAVLFSSAFAQTKDSVLTSGGKLKPEQAIMDVRHYTIALNVDFSQRSIEGYTIIDVIMAKPTKVLMFDLMNDYAVHSVWVNGSKQSFDFKDKL